MRMFQLDGLNVYAGAGGCFTNLNFFHIATVMYGRRTQYWSTRLAL